MDTPEQREVALKAATDLALQDFSTATEAALRTAVQMIHNQKLGPYAVMQPYSDTLVTAATKAAVAIVDAHVAAGASDPDDISSRVTETIGARLTGSLRGQFPGAPQGAAGVGWRRSWSQYAGNGDALLRNIPNMVQVALAKKRASAPPRLDRWILRAKDHPLVAGVLLAYMVLTSLFGQGPMWKTFWSLGTKIFHRVAGP